MILPGQIEMDVVKEHIERIHNQAKGYITLANKANDSYSQKHYSLEQLETGLKSVVGLENTYISQNTFYKPQRRIENIKQIRNCYIDLDCYNTEYSKDAVLYFLKQDYFNNKIPQPNLIIDSGRGLYLVWNIEPVPYMALPLWRAVEGYLYNQLKEFGADPKALDPTRVLRIAGTINTKTGTEVSILEGYDYLYTLKEIKKNYLPEIAPERKTKGRKKAIVNLYNEYSLYHARMLDLITLCEIRSWDMEGHRETVCFLYRYWTCCFIGDAEDALEQTLELNNRFIIPLTRKEVVNATKSAERAYLNADKQYKYKNETLIELLGITEEEQQHLKSIISKPEKYKRNNQKRRQARRNEAGLTKREQLKQDRIKQIEKLKQQGLKQKEIAETLGISITTVKYHLYN